MTDLTAALTRIALNPAYHDLFSIAKGARNGLVYGAKIRFPHALVMVFLFGTGTPREKMSKILTATRQHATRLCKYVAIYKTLMIVQRDLFTGGKQQPYHSFIAGMIGGWYMFGDRTAVNEQIVLYCVGRIVASFLPRAEVPPTYPPNRVIPVDDKAHQIFAAVTWGTVMWLFMNRRQRLNGGLVNSMDCTSLILTQTCTSSRTSGTACGIWCGTMSDVQHTHTHIDALCTKQKLVDLLRCERGEVGVLQRTFGWVSVRPVPLIRPAGS